MPGPRTHAEALTWIQEAVKAGRYVPSTHFYDRLLERAIDILDVFHAVEQATACAPYEHGAPEHGGTCWRLSGWNVDRDRHVTIGVEAFLDKKRRRCILCTVFKPGE